MAFWDSQEIVGEVQKNKVEKFIISNCEVEGRRFVDVRTYRHFKDGEFQPTSKGIVVPFDKKEELIELLNSIDVTK